MIDTRETTTTARMNPRWRERIAAAVAGCAAVWLAYNLAEGSLALPLLAAALSLALIATQALRMPLDAILLGSIFFGYIVGNRGFAQVLPVPGLPLFPAELVLGVAGACLLWRSAAEKSLPWRRDALNYLLLAWIVVGTARVVVDVPRHGFLALRDYAMVYYTAFFFVAQKLGSDPRIRRYLENWLLLAAGTLPVVFALFQLFPDFFLGTLTFRGVPLVYYKGDLALVFFAVGGIFLYLAMPPPHQRWARPLGVVMVLWMFGADNRAAMLGTVVALAWVARSRFRAFTFIQFGAMALAFLLLIGAAAFLDHPLAIQKTRSITERAMSIVDLTGSFNYRHEDTLAKTDNNQFRWVWWRTVTAETAAQNPVFGLGFGYDLARGFLQEYNPDMAEEFTARSPHNLFVTTFGRLGVVGVGILLWIYLLLIVETRRVMRDPQSEVRHIALWAALWPVAISACLGVVLEGPMGAVIFWSLLGLAHTYQTSTLPVEAVSMAEPAPGHEIPAAKPLPGLQPTTRTIQ